jgi:hypothetical protein
METLPTDILDYLFGDPARMRVKQLDREEFEKRLAQFKAGGTEE